MTCLTIVQDACGALGIKNPNAVITSNDTQIKQLLALSNIEGQLLSQKRWQALNLQATFVTVAQEDQGDIATIAPGFRYIINDTIWDRDLRHPIWGPQSPQTAQQQRGLAITGPWSQFRINQGQIIFYPIPAPGDNCYFEYVSKNWASQVGGTTSDHWTADSDVSLLDEFLMTLGLIWRWRAAKRLDYGEEKSTYEKNLLDVLARDGGGEDLDLANHQYDIYPAVVVPAGNWNLS